MKQFRAAFACLLFVSASAVAAPAQPPLPKDSVYQLPLQLTDQQGKSWDWRSKRGKPQVVAMFYTSCQFTCPLIVDSGKAIEHALTQVDKTRVGILLISMDPKRDTPAALMKVFDRRGLDGTRWSLASPKLSGVRSVSGVLGVRYRQLASGDFNHTSELILLDREGRIVSRSDKIGSLLDPTFIASVRRTIDLP